jgi:hypothetical protein
MAQQLDEAANSSGIKMAKQMNLDWFSSPATD